MPPTFKFRTNALGKQIGPFVNYLQGLMSSINVAVDQDVVFLIYVGVKYLVAKLGQHSLYNKFEQ